MDWNHWDDAIVGLIIVHWILFCIRWYNMPESVIHALRNTQAAIVFFFVIDIAMRAIVRGVHFEFKTAIFGVQISVLEVLLVGRKLYHAFYVDTPIHSV